MIKKPFKILCIDGGGIKGLYSAELLAKFEKVFGCVISDCFDMLCGTSTGGIIALAASLKIPMSDVVLFYQKHGPLIFNESIKQDQVVVSICVQNKLLMAESIPPNPYDQLLKVYLRTG